MPESAFVAFSIDQVIAQRIRSGEFAIANSGSDTNFLTLTAGSLNGISQTVTRALGDMHDGDTTGQTIDGKPIGVLSIGPFRVFGGDPVAFNYLIMNNGHDSQAKVDSLLTSASTSLAQKGVQAVSDALTKALGAGAGAAAAGTAAAAGGAATGGTLGSAVLPIIGTIIGAVVGWLLSDAFGIIFATCDGVVAAEQVMEDITQLWLFTQGSAGFSQTTTHPGTDSPSGCGKDSIYVTKWSINVHWINRSIGLGVCSSVSRIQSHVDVFWVAPDGSVRSAWWDVNANNSNWNAEFNVAPPSSAARGQVTSVARITTHIDLFWAAPDGSVRSAWWDANANDGNWNGMFNIAPSASAVPGPVTALARIPTHIDLFWSAPDGSVRSAWWDANANNGNWNGMFNIAPSASAVPGPVTALSRIPTHIDLFWAAPDGSVRSAWWDANVNNGNWNSMFNIAPSASAIPGPVTALSRIPTHIDLFWSAPDGSVRSAWWDASVNNGNWNGMFNIAPQSSAAVGPVVALARTPSQLNLFWVCQDGSVEAATWPTSTSNTNWLSPFKIAPAGSAVPGSLVAHSRITALQLNVVNPGPRIEVFWIAPDGSIRMSDWSEPLAWRDAVRIVVSAGSAVPGSLSLIARISNHVDLFWSAPDGSVRTTYWDDAASSWAGAFDIAPPASSVA